MKKMLAFLLALLMVGMTGAAFAEGSTIIHQDGDPDFDAMTIEQWEQYEVPCPKPSHPSTFSFLNLYEYTLSSSRPSFPKEYGLKAARRAPQFSKRRVPFYTKAFAPYGCYGSHRVFFYAVCFE